MIDQSVIKSQVQNVIKHYIFIFYVLFEILIEKCSFLVSWQFIAKLAWSTNWDSAIYRSIDWYVVHPCDKGLV